jgi:hypothetical protein
MARILLGSGHPPWQEATTMQAVAMDHRCGHRREAAQTVLLRRNGWAGYLVGELRDVSISGAKVAVPARAFPLRTLVRLEVTVEREGRRQLVGVPAMVVRHTQGGIGLAFDELQSARLLAGLARQPALALA